MRLVASLLLSSAALAQEPTPATAAAPTAPSCSPPCRAGYLCVDGQCVSQCNPACPEGQICRDGDCVRDPNAPPPSVVVLPPPGGGGGDAGMIEPSEGGGGGGSEESYYPNDKYIGIGGGGTFLVTSRANYSPKDAGEIDIEFGQKYLASQIALLFPEEAFIFALNLRIYYPIELKTRVFLEPQFGLAFANWFADAYSLYQIGIGPGVRLRYDVARSFALYLQVFRMDIMLLSYLSPETGDSQKLDDTLVYLNMGAGIQIRY